MLSQLPAFLAVSALLVAIPGPATTLVMKNATVRGLRSAMVTASGVLTADLVWMLASVAGLTAILVASETAFLAVRLIGAAFLIYLGARLLLARVGGHAIDTSSIASRPATAARAYREGVICDLSNPKTLLVFTSVIPQFLSESPGPVALSVFGTVFAIAGFLSLTVYAVVFAQARQLTQRPRTQAWFLRISGGILVLFGARVALEPVE